MLLVGWAQVHDLQLHILERPVRVERDSVGFVGEMRGNSDLECWSSGPLLQNNIFSGDIFSRKRFSFKAVRRGSRVYWRLILDVYPSLCVSLDDIVFTTQYGLKDTSLRAERTINKV